MARLHTVQQKTAFKPTGLWYACGSSWVDWAESEGYDYGDLVYLVTIDERRMLTLRTEELLLEFGKAYSVDGGDRVEWGEVAKKWSGIEICPARKDLRFEEGMGWYQPWDVASGCVWDASAAKVEYIGLWDGENMLKPGELD